MTLKRQVARITVIPLLLLAGCSTDQQYKRQANGNETYLDAPSLQVLHVPSGMALPLRNNDFYIKATSLPQAVGKQVDIRPPAQPVPLLNGSRAEYANGIGKFVVENNARNRNLWSQILKVMQDNNFPLLSHQSVNQTLMTDWLTWSRADEDTPLAGRYQISVQPQGYQWVLMVKSVELQQAGQPVTDKSEIQRYNSMMLNSIINGLDKMFSDFENDQRISKTETLYVQNGIDDTGLPLLIVRTTYNTLWQRLPAALTKAGMKVTDSSRAQGMLKVSYENPGSTVWAALGAKNPELQEGDYKLQVGDLDNRSSLQFIDPKGHTLTQTQNDALVTVFQAVLNQKDTE